MYRLIDVNMYLKISICVFACTSENVLILFFGKIESEFGNSKKLESTLIFLSFSWKKLCEESLPSSFLNSRPFSPTLPFIEKKSYCQSRGRQLVQTVNSETITSRDPQESILRLDFVSISTTDLFLFDSIASLYNSAGDRILSVFANTIAESIALH